MTEEGINKMIISINESMGYNMAGIDPYNEGWREVKIPPTIKKTKKEAPIRDIYINPIVVKYIDILKDNDKYNENHFITKSLLANIDKKVIDERNITYWESIIKKIVDNK